MINLLINNPYSLGDAVVMSAAIRDLAEQHADKYVISCVGNYSGYWAHHPYVKPVNPDLISRAFTVDYHPYIAESKSGKGKHFLTALYDQLQRSLNIKLTMSKPYGDLYCAESPPKRIIEGKYWVITSGGKDDMTNKWWLPSRYQEVVDKLLAQGIHCVQIGSTQRNAYHKRLNNVIYAVGATENLFDLNALIANSEGVICGITSFMHIAAAFNKPCVVIAGGREERKWEAYTNEGQFPAEAGPVPVPHIFLDTIGKKDCCESVGCWRARVVPLSYEDMPDSLCRYPIRTVEQPVAGCLYDITSDQVVDGVLSYYRSGLLTKGDKAPTTTIPLRPVMLDYPPVEYVPPAEDKFAALNHPFIRGRYTVFVLCSGDYPDLAKRCIGDIVRTMPRDRLDLRVAMSAVGNETKRYLNSLTPGVITRLYDFPEGDKKYVVMRKMFNDPEYPILTQYLVWFDDDTFVVDDSWPIELAKEIAANHLRQYRLYGFRYLHDPKSCADPENPLKWFKEAKWWRDRQLLDNVPGWSSVSENGTIIPFAAGYFWALHADTMRFAQIPDERLNHNGGDITIGAQVLQADFRLCDFNTGKKYVSCPTRDQGGRRGYSEAFPWAQTQWQKFTP